VVGQWLGVRVRVQGGWRGYRRKRFTARLNPWVYPST